MLQHPLQRIPSEIATGRSISLFAQDVAVCAPLLRECLQGRRVLVIGGAGSIGGATVRELADFPLEALHVTDHNENALAELARDLRSSTRAVSARELRLLPLDFGSPIFERHLLGNSSYDFVLNFAALKHVRSEKDVPSILQLLDTNVLKAVDLLAKLKRAGTRRYFCVSTDKAANPVSLMGASKRLMEAAIFEAGRSEPLIETVSARFANVAFSNGSLLEAFLFRMGKEQPLAVPRNTQRYFVSVEEAGQLCILAAILAPDLHILIPRLNPAQHLIALDEVVTRLLDTLHLQPRFYSDEDEARARVAADVTEGFYPVLLTPLDTSGEKPFEEFVGEGEEVLELGMRELLALSTRRVDGPTKQVLDQIRRMVSDSAMSTTKAEIVAVLSSVIPQFAHRETGRSLDQRM